MTRNILIIDYFLERTVGFQYDKSDAISDLPQADHIIDIIISRIVISRCDFRRGYKVLRRERGRLFLRFRLLGGGTANRFRTWK